MLRALRSRLVKSGPQPMRRGAHPQDPEHRSWQKRYARRHGLAWTTCPLCGLEFGGHEASAGIAPIPDEPDERSESTLLSPDLIASSVEAQVEKAQTICAWCACERLLMAEELLEELGKNVTFHVHPARTDQEIIHHVPGGFWQPD